MMATSRTHQHGAVTLVGALFLIMAIIILLGAVQRMAATDITDTALHNDGVEALFIAESGLERAGWRYTTGSSCPALAGESDTVGRGSFQITSAAMAGTLCKVRVTGNVVTTIAGNAVNRTIEGSFSRGSYTGWAVGDASATAVLLGWDGSSWSSVSAPAVPVQDLHSVYCITTDDCWAVGDPDGSSANINHWDGSTWSNLATPGVPNVSLYSVHCVATDDCWAVGQKNGNAENLNHWNGSSWSNITAPAVPNKDLNSIDCVAGNDCWTAGAISGGENIDHWNGSSWSRDGPYASIPNNNLNEVSIVSSTEAYVVGDNGTLASWDGSNWAGQTSPVSSNLNSASVIGGAGGGGVTLVQWTEVIQ